MNEIFEIERCSVCKESVAEGRRYCRFYPNEEQISCCSPECAERYLRGPDHRSNGSWHGDLIAEMVEELRWTNGGFRTLNGHYRIGATPDRAAWS